MMIGYLYGITSERRLLGEIGLNLAYRWFTGLGFDQSIPDHSTFSKNRHGRFRDSSVFRDLFESIVQQCVNVGLVQRERNSRSVDGAAISADASSKSRVSRERLHNQPISSLLAVSPLHEPRAFSTRSNSFGRIARDQRDAKDRGRADRAQLDRDEAELGQQENGISGRSLRPRCGKRRLGRQASR